MTFPNPTARTRLGSVDMVPLMRRLGGDLSVDIPTHERHAAVLALADMELSLSQIMHASGLGQATVETLLDQAPTGRSRAEKSALERDRYRRRLAERIDVNGRLIHPRAPHGRPNSYSNWGCRCMPCTRANTAQCADRRNR